MDQPSSRLSYTVLIIDKPQDRETYRQYLSQSHHTSTIFEAALGAEGLALYEQHQINAVLLSNDLPDISAVEFLAKLDLSEPWLPVVVVAEDDSASSAVKVMKAGAQDFLVRPQLTATALQHAIESVVHEQYRGYDGCKLALQKQADRLRIATASAHLGIWDWNLAINEITWDNECRAMFGVTPDTEVTTELFFKAVHPSDRDRVEQAVNAALSPSGNGSYEVEYRTIGVEDGVERWIKARGQAYFTHSKKPQRFIGTVVEVTQRKRAELALAERAQELAKLNGALGRMTVDLEERNKDLNQFAYVASHDLKAPLRSIRNLSEWLKEDIGSTIPPENQQQLTLIIERIDRMDALLNALLNYARAGRNHQSREWLDTEALLREIIDILSPPQEIAIHLSPSLPRVWGSRLALTQVFINLISNAIKYGCVDQRGKITISAREQPDCYEFTVADKGSGIAPSHHDRIFGIFERLQNPNESTGTGIGLAIVKRIVETEGGSVRIESSPGTGSAFIFTWRKS